MDCLSGFSFICENGFIKVNVSEAIKYPSYGYTNMRGVIEIKAGNYYVKGNIQFDLNDIILFYKKLQEAYDNVAGDGVFTDEAGIRFYIKASFNSLGHVNITGMFKEKISEGNKLEFDLQTDQSIVVTTLAELKMLITKVELLEA